MFNLTTAPMANNSNQVQQAKEVNKVYKTSDLSVFKSLNGNRTLNKSHVKRIVSSMSHKKLFSPILVNEKMEVIDGQHRLESCKVLNIPLEYIIINGYGLNEVQKLNMNSKDWSSDDFMNAFCDLGISDYIKYREFKDKYGFGHSECQAILSNQVNANLQPLFYSGNFKIDNIKMSYDIAEKIKLVSNFYLGYKRRSFVFALMRLFSNENFEFTQFLQKLKLQPTALVDCTNTNSYLMLIEEIYNYRSRNKVNLRYL